MHNSSVSHGAEYGPSSQDGGDAQCTMREISRYAAMPDTGFFYVLDLDAARDEQGHLEHVNAISIRCNRCRHITHLKVPQLESMPGGTLLACAGCGERQAVSNARLVECDHVLGHAPPASLQA